MSQEHSIQRHSQCPRPLFLLGAPFILYISGEFDFNYNASYVLWHTTEALPTAVQRDSRNVRSPQSVIFCESCQEQRVLFTLAPSEICR